MDIPKIGTKVIGNVEYPYMVIKIKDIRGYVMELKDSDTSILVEFEKDIGGHDGQSVRRTPKMFYRLKSNCWWFNIANYYKYLEEVNKYTVDLI